MITYPCTVPIKKPILKYMAMESLIFIIITNNAGFIDASAVQELLCECARMKNFSNLHVMSLKGVCLDEGPVPYIVLPYMTNGSLASYLKKERKNLVIMKDSTTVVTNESEDSAQVSFFYTCRLFCEVREA